MIRDRSAIWVGVADFLLCCLGVVIVAVAPKTPPNAGIDPKAEFLLTAEWNVDIDADVDLWLVGPSKKPVFYQSRDVDCATLDRDNRGLVDSLITLPDGSQTKIDSDRETIALHCVVPGHYDVAANLYSYHEAGKRVDRHGIGLPVHVEVVAVHPAPHVVYSKDVVLDHSGQTVNAISFDMSRDGTLTEASPPLEAITKKFQTQVPSAP